MAEEGEEGCSDEGSSHQVGAGPGQEIGAARRQSLKDAKPPAAQAAQQRFLPAAPHESKDQSDQRQHKQAGNHAR